MTLLNFVERSLKIRRCQQAANWRAANVNEGQNCWISLNCKLVSQNQTLSVSFGYMDIHGKTKQSLNIWNEQSIQNPDGMWPALKPTISTHGFSRSWSASSKSPWPSLQHLSECWRYGTHWRENVDFNFNMIQLHSAISAGSNDDHDDWSTLDLSHIWY